MTKLTKPVHRITNKRYGKHAVVITLASAGSKPEALIGLRLKGKRTQYVISLTEIYMLAALRYGNREAAAKRLARRDGVPWRIAKKAFAKENTLQ